MNAQPWPTFADASVIMWMTGGTAWGCRTTPPATAPGCQLWPLPVRTAVRPAGIVLDPTLRAGFDGGYSVGGVFSAAPPAAALGQGAK